MAYDPDVVHGATLAQALLATTSPGLVEWERDVGELSGLRSALFLCTASDAQLARAAVAAAREMSPDPIHTAVMDWLPEYVLAPDFDRDYFRRKPGDSYSCSIIAPKLARLALLLGHDAIS